MNLSLSPFGFRPLSRSASLNEISLLISEFNCHAPLECHNIHFSVFMLLYIPQLSLIYLASLIFSLVFIKFILIAEMDFFNPLKFFYSLEPTGHNHFLAVHHPFVRTASGEGAVKRRKNIMAGTRCDCVLSMLKRKVPLSMYRNAFLSL